MYNQTRSDRLLAQAEAIDRKYEAEKKAHADRVKAHEDFVAQRKAEDEESKRKLDAANEVKLAALKRERKIAFFSAHPGATPAEFESFWSKVKQDVLESEHARAVERTRQEMRASGRYARMS
jgi:type II secretory pathway component PulC